MLFRILSFLIFLGFGDIIVAQKSPGYTLIYTTSGTGNKSAKLVDTSGNTYKSWSGFASSSGYSAYILPGGFLLRATIATGVSFTGGPICGKISKTDWTGALVWDYTYSTINYCSHHDICPMPNGDVLLISYERRTATEVTAMGGSAAIEMWPDKIVQVHQTGPTTGDVVWEWKAWDHLQQNVSTAKPNYKSTLVPEKLNINYKQTKDWMHMNGVDYNPELDQVCFSSHYLNEIYIIDHSTTMAEAASSSGGRSGKGGDILYRFGNPAAYGATGAATINVCHDAHWIDVGPYKGYLAYFGNNGISTTQSSVDYVNPPLQSSGFNYIKTGTQYGPSTYTKRYACNGYTSNEGGSQTFANGNLMYTVALAGNIYEVDSNGSALGTWSAGGKSAKAKRYSACELNGGLLATCSPYYYNLCGVPASSIVLNCNGVGSGTMTYKWTSYPSGFTSTAQNPSVTPTASTTYICEVSNGTCTATNYVVVNIRPKPTVNLGNDTTISPSQPLTLKANSTNTLSYRWSNGATTQNIQISPAITTTYKVVVTSEGGCIDSDEVTVNVVGGLLSVVATANPGGLCLGSSTNLNASGSGGSGNYTYSWSSVPTGFTSTLKNPVVTPMVNTQFLVVVNDGNSAANSSCNVVVNPIPFTPTIVANGNFFTSSLALTYQWYQNGIAIPGAISQIYQATSPGNYTVKIKDANGCESLASNSTVFVGVQDFSFIQNINIYPNPSTGKFTIETNDDFFFEVVDYSGKLVLLSSAHEVDLGDFENGIYIIKIYKQSQIVAVRKFNLVK